MKVGAIYKANAKFAEEYEKENHITGYGHPFAIIRKEKKMIKYWE